MRNKFDYTEGIFTGLCIAVLLLLFSLFISNWISPVPYQNSRDNTTPSTSPADLGELTTRVQNLENDLIYNFKNFEWRLDQKILYLGWIALVISVVAGSLGIKTFNDIQRIVDEEVRRSLDKALYHLDPTNLKIWVISYDKEITLQGDMVLGDDGKPQLDENEKPIYEKIRSNVSTEMEEAGSRILLTGLLNLETIPDTDHRCYNGVTIVPVFDKDMEGEFRKFVRRNKDHLDPKRAAFVLYSKDYRISQTKTISLYSNLAIANMVPTVASTILTVGRGLSNITPIKSAGDTNA